MAWTLSLPDGDDPLFVRIARALTEAILQGRLPPGARLPGTRTLATTLGVHRNTVLAAYAELVSEGWLQGEAARGTFVASELPTRPSRRFARRTTPGLATRAGFSLERMPPPQEEPAVFQGRLAGAVPDAREIPVAAMARAWRRAASRPAHLDYGDARGHPALRRALAELVASSRALPATMDDVLVTRGSQMAIELATRALIRPGDLVAVEALSYRSTRLALQRAGATLMPLTLDERGARVDDLRGRGVRAVYLTPHHQYPTTATLAPERRLALVELAAQERFAIVEDDYDHEFHFDGRPIAPLASADRNGNVIYIGSLSKVLAPALRLGFVIAPAPILERMTRLREGIDRQGDTILEAAVAELITDGELQRHTRRMRRVYEARRDHCAEQLSKHFGNEVAFQLPAGGMALWFRAPGVDIERWAGNARSLGGGFPTERSFAWDGRVGTGGRIAYAAITEAELRDEVRLLVRALPA